ncbi:hypothetical protein UK15_23085 [Streptomyces variegatus]|uniref:Uncharacterized protein n=1 Tax=Streptomyces variegatus TaxID=284040 RepID=A0A0M2GPM5_9ACTN|nr:hypothetical protein UK15_23085 [Streptomyces variegatus]
MPDLKHLDSGSHHTVGLATQQLGMSGGAHDVEGRAPFSGRRVCATFCLSLTAITHDLYASELAPP